MGSEMLDMGKYGLFIWTTYGVSMGALLMLAVISYRKKRAFEKQVATFASKEKK
jgi:heme exporter protein CcmD